jgi:hypothetical protein
VACAHQRRRRHWLDFLDQVLRQQVEAKQRKRIAMGIHGPPGVGFSRRAQIHDRDVGMHEIVAFE